MIVPNNSEELQVLNTKTNTNILIYCLGGFLCLGYIYIIIIRVIIAIRINWDKLGVTYNKQRKYYKAIPKYIWDRLINLINWALTITQSQDLWCIIPCTIFALLGMILNFYFFVFCIIIIFIYSDNLMEVVLAIWEPKYRIAWTLLLTLCVLYIYSALSFTQFREDYSLSIPESCDTMYNCLITIIDQWYKNGDLGGFLSNAVPAIQEEGTFKINWGRFLFDLMFFIIVPTLLINIVSGIIIDNFGERRGKRDQLSEYQHSRCFVWGNLDNDIEDFSNHTKYLHNCWDYVYYIGYLKNTPFEDLVDYIDIYVKNMIESNRVDWFPCYFKDSDQANDRTPIQENTDKNEQDESINQAIDEGINSNIENRLNKLETTIGMLESKFEDKLDWIEVKFEDKFDKIMTLLEKLK